jgi:hypothetical protein
MFVPATARFRLRWSAAFMEKAGDPRMTVVFRLDDINAGS